VRIPESLQWMEGWPPGRDWLARVPELVTAASERFGVTPGGPFDGGMTAWVAPVSAEAVLKVRFLDDESAGEPAALAFFDGDGAVRLLADAPDLGAMLVERAQPGHRLEELGNLWDAVEIACVLLRRLWRPVPSTHRFPTAAERATGWAVAIAECPAVPIEWRELAASRAASLAVMDGPLVLGNQDFHLGNVVAAGREPWLLIDPKPVVASPAFDTGHLVRDVVRLGSVELPHVRESVDRIAAGLALESRLVLDWALVRTAVNVVSSASDGERPDAADLRLGDLLLRLR
jgi:streptomycin 6-kinase